jgi:hypothetical protein
MASILSVMSDGCLCCDNGSVYFDLRACRVQAVLRFRHEVFYMWGFCVRGISIAWLMIFSLLCHAEEVVMCPPASDYRKISTAYPSEVNGWRALSGLRLDSRVEPDDASELTIVLMLERWDGIEKDQGLDFNTRIPDDTEADPSVYSLWETDKVSHYVRCVYDRNKNVIYRLRSSKKECVDSGNGGMVCE